jgi:pilus assembly protein CpaC
VTGKPTVGQSVGAERAVRWQVNSASENRMSQRFTQQFNRKRTTVHFIRASALAVAFLLALAAPASRAQTQSQSGQAGGAPEELHLLVGRSLIITSPGRIKRVSVADPTIAEAIVVTPNQVLLNGKAPGGVSLLIWDETDQSQAFEVSVDIDVLSLAEKIHEVFPNEPVNVESSKDSVMLSGKISSAAVADKILEVVKNATPKVTSLMEVPAPLTGEILLEVKFAEVDKTALQQLGVNLLVPGGKNVGQISTQQFSPPIIQGQIGSIGGGSSSSSTSTTGTSSTSNTTFGLGDLLNIFIYRPDINLGATIQALQSNDVAQILAEPNVLTVSGKEASFLAGGEFPYPVVQSAGSNSFPTISIQFKEFGVKLNFTPTLMADGLIHLKVTPEVSALDYTNALTISGFTIPALSTRRVTSEMDLQDGQSFAIAGLMDNRLTEEFSKIPWIGDVPILGNLFKSRSLDKTKDELLVVVTPRIVHPLAANQIPPGPVFPKPFLPGPTYPQTQQPPVTK